MLPRRAEDPTYHIFGVQHADCSGCAVVVPSATLIICMHGCRLRRKKEAQKEAKSGPRLLSSLGLTPGTPLMAMIQESLTYYICRRLQTSAWQHLHFELSGATVKVAHMQFCTS